MDTDHIDLRGGLPRWIFAALGLLGGMAMAVVPVIVTIARMPDGTRFDVVRDDVATIKQRLAVMEARQEGKAALDDARNKALEAKVDQLLKHKP